MVGSFSGAPADVLATLLGQEGSGGEVVIDSACRAPSPDGLRRAARPAGALMQVLLRNPLADPYVLGISGGPGRGHTRRS